MRFKIHAAGAACALVLVSLSATASDYKAEYDKKIKASQNVGVLGNDLAGDRVNFYTGATSFSATDVAIPGNAMGISISRSFAVEPNRMAAAYHGSVDESIPETYASTKRLFGDWDLDVPHLSTVMSQADGWLVDTTTPTQRCRVLGKTFGGSQLAATGVPPMATGTRGWHFGGGIYWHGYTLHTGGGEQSLLLASKPNVTPPPSGGPYHWTTNQNWWLSCLTSTANGVAGDAFVAHAPDGKVYQFDWMSKRDVEAVTEYDDEIMTSHVPARLFRSEYMLLPTIITDRFQNWVRYNWVDDGAGFARLQSVTYGSAGSTTPEATITLTYNAQGNISKVNDGTREWNYGYISVQDSGPEGGSYTYQSLKSVTLPDGSAWDYQLGSPDLPDPACAVEPEMDPEDQYWWCFGIGDVQTVTVENIVKHPSGATIKFWFTNHFQYSNSNLGSYPLGLAKKEISGVGLTTSTWTYDYLLTKPDAKALCQASNCPQLLATDQVNPDNSITRRVFGLNPVKDETLLLAEYDGSVGASGGGSPAITTSNRWTKNYLADTNPTKAIVPTWYRATNYYYPTPNQAPVYTEVVGSNPVSWGGYPAQTFASERRLPMVKRDVIQQDVTFTSNTTLFDTYARPDTTVRSSTGAYTGSFSKTEQTTYHDNTSLWVLGQVKKVQDIGTGRVIGETTFDPTTALPLSSYSFGRLKQTLAYNANGTLASATDGRGKTVTLGNWYRGVPRAITFPGGATMAATVAADGNILSTTDELSNVSSYAYDSLGRLNKIIYPTGDSVAWTDTSRSFSFVTAPEFGLPANHWKQVVDSPISTGAGAAIARTTTLYDARFNPVLTMTEDTSLSGSRSFVVRRFDSMGRETFRSYPVASANVSDALTGFVTEYDALGRVVKVKQDSEPTEPTLDTLTAYLTGFQTRVTNPRGYSTTTSYQVFDAPSTDAPVRIDAPQGVTTVITRDVFGKPKQITRSGSGG